MPRRCNRSVQGPRARHCRHQLQREFCDCCASGCRPQCVRLAAIRDGCRVRLTAAACDQHLLGVLYRSINGSVTPGHLVASGPVVKPFAKVNFTHHLTSQQPTWVRLPLLNAPPVTSGVYWFGARFSDDVTCFGAPSAKNAPGAGWDAKDAFAPGSFAAGAPKSPSWSAEFARADDCVLRTENLPGIICEVGLMNDGARPGHGRSCCIAVVNQLPPFTVHATYGPVGLHGTPLSRFKLQGRVYDFIKNNIDIDENNTVGTAPYESRSL